ncbi:P-loop NTPase [Bdellovibrionota bacterium FG-1]
MFEKIGVPVRGFIENMSWFKGHGCDKKHELFGQGGGKGLARKFDLISWRSCRCRGMYGKAAMRERLS